MSKPNLVIFDLDNTILNGDSDYSMINYLIENNFLGKSAEKRNEKFMDEYINGKLDMSEYAKFTLSAYVGKTQQEIDEIIRPFIKTVVESMINVFALKLIHDHKDKGDELLLASATNELIVNPIARRLDFKSAISTKVEFINGKCTGFFLHPLTIGSGKFHAVKSWMEEHKYSNFLGTIFYSDSINDLPLLESVETPKVVNPDIRLEKIANKRGWEIINLPKI